MDVHMSISLAMAKGAGRRVQTICSRTGNSRTPAVGQRLGLRVWRTRVLPNALRWARNGSGPRTEVPIRAVRHLISRRPVSQVNEKERDMPHF
jgi:hypothetical protein